MQKKKNGEYIKDRFSEDVSRLRIKCPITGMPDVIAQRTYRMAGESTQIMGTNKENMDGEENMGDAYSIEQVRA